MNKSLVSYLSQFSWYSDINLLLSEFFGSYSSLVLSITIFALACGLVAKVMALVGGLGTYAERKISADMQMRHGPNRVGPFGLLQFLADGVKMILKEDIIPTMADKFIFSIAPIFCMVGVFASLAVLPFSENLTLSNLNVGVFYFLGVTSMVGVGIFLGGYSSNSKWSMLGGMRGAAQIISYEVPVTLTFIMIVLLAGSLSFNDFITAQSGGMYNWYVFHNPFTFIGSFIYFISALAETNRAPFDLPEAESELVSGYHTEYSGMRFGFFALAEYVEVFVVCAIAVTMFLGGYYLPFGLTDLSFWKSLLGDTAISYISVEAIQVCTFFLKTFVLYYVVIWIRWTLPRLRVDQLMSLCWKYLTPIALFNLVGSACWVYFFNGKSVVELILN